MATKRLWRWRGLSDDGALHQDLLWAEHRGDALLTLQQQHIIPLTLRRCAVRAAHWRPGYGCALIQQLATLLQAGLTLSDSLTLLAQQHPSPQWRALLHSLARQLLQGESLSDALRQWPQAFPPLYHALIQTGELTGKLEQCCQALARQQRQEIQLTMKVRKALRYPLIVLTLAMGVVMAMLGFVLPEFAAIYRTFNTPLPALTRAVIAIGGFVESQGLFIALAAALPFLANRLCRRDARWLMFRQRLLLAAPVLGDLQRGRMLSHIFTVLALTQSAGIAFLQGLESVEATLDCPWWRGVIQQLRQQITQGAAIWQALEETGVFTPLCLQLVRTGEVSGALESMLNNLAQHHSDKTHQQADNLASLMEPLLLLVVGAIVGILVVAMYLPIFHLGDALSGIG